MQWGIQNISTSAGILVVDTRYSFNASFTSGAVPAPGAVALLGVAGLSGRRRR